MLEGSACDASRRWQAIVQGEGAGEESEKEVCKLAMLVSTSV